MEINKATAEKVRAVMDAKDRNVSSLSRLSGIKRSTLARRLEGDGSFTMTHMYGLAKALEVPLSDLIPVD